MSDKAWGERVGLAPSVADDTEGEPEGYRAWKAGKTGLTRDLKIVPAAGSGGSTRYVPYLQTISLELNDTATELAVMCHSSGELIFIEGVGLDDVAEVISEKKAKSLHVWSATDGAKPETVITAVTFNKSLRDLAAPE